MFSDIKLYAIPVVIALILFKAVTRRNGGPLPPGPRGYPIIGNLFDILEGLGYDPSSWAKHKKLYGPISSVSAFGNKIVVLNELRTAVELLDKKSTVYSNRPSLVFCGEMIGWERNVTMLQYDDDRFRTTRKYMSQSIGSKSAVKQFNPIIELESRRLLACILETPEKLKQHVGKWAGAIILTIAYGYNVKRDGEDPLIQKIERVTRQNAQAGKPGAWLVDTLPFLRYLPDWIPGTGFKRIAREWREGLIETLDKPWAFVKGQIATGIAPDSFTSKLLKDSLSQEDETVVKWSAHAFYAAGSDTTVSTLYGFFLAMLLFPDVQKKAQAELDSVVGSDRLPCLQDREYLPYINAIVKEILRWNKVVGLGLPHVAAEDGMYGEYFIPKGSVLMPNIWFFNHDPDNFPDPMAFKPDRFLEVDGKKASKLDPFDISFGFGRRICPGKEFASSALFIAIAMSLSTFEISNAYDEKGKIIIPPMEWTIDVISHPVEFKCNIKPRSNKAKMLAESVNEEYPVPQSDVDLVL